MPCTNFLTFLQPGREGHLPERAHVSPVNLVWFSGPRCGGLARLLTLSACVAGFLPPIPTSSLLSPFCTPGSAGSRVPSEALGPSCLCLTSPDACPPQILCRSPCRRQVARLCLPGGTQSFPVCRQQGLPGPNLPGSLQARLRAAQAASAHQSGPREAQEGCCLPLHPSSHHLTAPGEWHLGLSLLGDSACPSTKATGLLVTRQK